MTDSGEPHVHEDEHLNPFPGLRPFEPDEDHLFFGRERETDELLRRLRENRFVSVLGTSGSGKSSLVRSGMIPSLYSGFMVQAGSTWRVAIFRPGEDPIGNLAAALNAPEVLGGTGDEENAAHPADVNAMLLETTLRRSDLGLADCIRHARLPGHENLLVVVDQFEELFRFKESRREHGSHDEAVAFAKLLLSAAAQDEMPVYVVITMRSDFIGDCMEYPGLPEAINRGQYLIPRMTRDELRQAITGPVAVGGGEISQRLVSRLLNEVGDDPDQLPVLQHALMRTWDHWQSGADGGQLDLEHYEAIGTMTDALSLHAEQAFEELPSTGARDVCERMFRALTDKRKDDRGVRRPTPVGEIAQIADVDVAEVVAVVDAFRRPGRSFLMPPAGVKLTADSILDLSHESLMRNWRRLAEWVDVETTAGKNYRRLCRAARRHGRGEGSLWVDPELSIGLQWRDETRPTETWARRYDPSFAEAMRFLDESKRAHDAALRAEEEERLAKLRRARMLATVLGSAAVVTLIFGLFALRAQRIASEAEAVATSEAETARAVTDFLVGLFEVVDPETGQGSNITAREILDQGAARIDTELEDQVEVSARMKRTVGKVYGSLGLYEEADPLLRQALETSEAVLGPDHPETLEARHRLAEVEWRQGHYNEAEELFQATLEGRRTVLGEEDLATLETKSGLARVYLEQGRYAEARDLARETADALASDRGADSREALDAEQIFGEALYELGEIREAETRLAEVFEVQKKALGEEDSDTVATSVLLGELYTEVGRYAEAELLYTAAVERRRESFGDEHPKTLMAEYRMANFKEESGLWGPAETGYVEVLAGQQRVLGDEHPNTLKTAAKLAWLYSLQDRLDEAEELASGAFEVSKRTMGEENTDTRAIANVLGAIYDGQGRYPEAEVIYLENLRIATERYGPAHPQTCTARNNLGVLYGDWGQNDRLAGYFAENLALNREKFGEDHPQTIFFQNNMVAGLQRQGKDKEAEALALDALERSERVLGRTHPSTLQSMRHLVNIYRGDSRYDEAISVAQDRVERHVELFGEAHPETLDARQMLVWIYQNKGQLEEAKAIMQEVLDGERAFYGEDHTATIGAYAGLAWLYELTNDVDRATELRRKALEGRRHLADRPEAGPHDKNRYANALINAKEGLRNPPEAIRFAREACEMTEWKHRNYIRTLANCYFADGDTESAIDALERALALVPEWDKDGQNWMESRLSVFLEMGGDDQRVRELRLSQIGRLREAATAPDATPRNRSQYGWTLLTVMPPDLRDPQTALQVFEVLVEETNHEDPDELTSLAFAQYQTGDLAGAEATQLKALELIPEDDMWSRTPQENRLLLYRGEAQDVGNPAARMPGVWRAQIGPVTGEVEWFQEGEYILGRNLKELPWAPAGEITHRIDVETGEVEYVQTDGGFTNPRWRPAECRFLPNGDMLSWGSDGFWVARFEKVQGP